MTLWENLLIALDNLKGNKMRSLLTIIGIVVGIAAVVTVVSIGQAGQTSLVAEVAQYGDGYFVLYPASRDGNVDINLYITDADLQLLRKMEGIVAAMGSMERSFVAKIGTKEVNVRVTGTASSYSKLSNMKMSAGQFFSSSEERSRQRVLVVESKFAETYFGSAGAALNQKVNLGGRLFRIVGVTKTEESLFSGLGGESYRAFAPMNAVPGADASSARFGFIEVKASAANEDELKEIVRQVKQWIAKRHNTEPDKYMAQTAYEVQGQVKQVFSILQVIIGSIAGISLFVGGIGVMNIMLVSVTERTREIGIRKAIGATPGLIMAQFIIEAVILSLAGGVIGAGIGLLGSWIFSIITQWPFLISWWALLLAVVFSTAVGVFFGLYPANKAARMQPIESLRYE
ncbi:ABC transporter permease [Paenibacillus alkalitolerans]|uniref:ABC transporter permease n=1 Tax=Paenibacillus alkalitolerans TaxID=2799335 RepID=UPI0018F4062F|nr:ABC transporter permease [Paenibacillus alkalitolerans]